MTEDASTPDRAETTGTAGRSAGKSWLSLPFRFVWFFLWFFGQQIHTTGMVVRDALLPSNRFTPGFLHYETHCRSDAEVTLLSCLITLTPGTLVIGAERRGKPGWWITVHGMYWSTPDELTETVHEMEDRMLDAVRREGFVR